MCYKDEVQRKNSEKLQKKFERKRLAIPLALADEWEPYGEYINRKWGDK